MAKEYNASGPNIKRSRKSHKTAKYLVVRTHENCYNCYMIFKEEKI